MPDSQFSERQYEFELNKVLFSNLGIIIPSQVQEQSLGFDAAGISVVTQLWDIVRKQFSNGLLLNAAFWNSFAASYVTAFPVVRANLFIQYKVPCYCTRRYRKYSNGMREEYVYDDWSRHWGGSRMGDYYYYDIDQGQFDKLLRLERAVGRMALVLYACPAFYSWVDMFLYSSSNSVVYCSNFASPSSMLGPVNPVTGINRVPSIYTFAGNGTFGRGYNSPGWEIDSKELDGLSNNDFLFGFERSCEENILHLGTVIGEINPVQGFDFEDERNVFTPLGKALLTVLSFCNKANCLWISA